MRTFLSQIHPGCHNDANGIKPKSNLKVTDKHAAEYSKTVCFSTNLCVMYELLIQKSPFTFVNVNYQKYYKP